MNMLSLWQQLCFVGDFRSCQLPLSTAFLLVPRGKNGIDGARAWPRRSGEE